MSFPIIQVDAFTDTPFSGNPAAVCILPSQVDEGWMQRVASEMNLSETAFVVKQEDGYGLRWFTPVSEVNSLRPRHACQRPCSLGEGASRL